MSSEDQQQRRQHVEPLPTVLHTTDGRTIRSSAGLGSEAPAGEASTVGLTGAPRGEALAWLLIFYACTPRAPRCSGRAQAAAASSAAPLARSDIPTHHLACRRPPLPHFAPGTPSVEAEGHAKLATGPGDVAGSHGVGSKVGMYWAQSGGDGQTREACLGEGLHGCCSRARRLPRLGCVLCLLRAAGCRLSAQPRCD